MPCRSQLTLPVLVGKLCFFSAIMRYIQRYALFFFYSFPESMSNHVCMHVFIIWQTQCSDWFFLGQDFAVRTVDEEDEHFDVETKTGITECHVIDNLPRSVLPPYFARSVLPGPRANIPQYGPSKLG